MIGTDTNILVRACLEDDENQAQLAQDFLQKTAQLGKLFISSYAILEFVWVLKVKKMSRADIYNIVITLLDSPGITIGQRDIILNALTKYLKGKGDFGDYMIIAEGEAMGCYHLKTFDEMIISENKHYTRP